MNTMPAGSNGGSARNAASAQPKRISSSLLRRSIISAPSNPATEPSKSRMTVRDIGIPAAIRLEPSLRTFEHEPEKRIANPDGVHRRREPRTELPLHFGIRPARDVHAVSVLQRVLEIVKPAHRVQIVIARGGILEADVLVDEPVFDREADIPSDEPPAGAIAEQGSAAGSVSKEGAEEVFGEKVEVHVALLVHIPVEPVNLSDEVVAVESRIAGANRFDLDLFPAPKLAAKSLSP